MKISNKVECNIELGDIILFLEQYAEYFKESDKTSLASEISSILDDVIKLLCLLQQKISIWAEEGKKNDKTKKRSTF